MINYNYLYILSIIIFGGWLFIGAALLYIYEKMGVKRNWIALIPFLGYKPLFDYVGISYWTMLVIFIPKFGTDIFMFLISLQRKLDKDHFSLWEFYFYLKCFFWLWLLKKMLTITT